MGKFLVTTLLVLFFVGHRAAMAEQTATDSSAPSYDMKAQALLDLENVQKKFVDLANAVPADKFGWKPSNDSRSFAEVLMHVAGERYQILALMGAAPPSDFDGKTFEKSTADKEKIIAQLDKTWVFAKQTIAGMSNADFAKPLPKLGPQATAGDVVYILVADAHEHLGQAIAYARGKRSRSALDRGGAEKGRGKESEAELKTIRGLFKRCASKCPFCGHSPLLLDLEIRRVERNILSDLARDQVPIKKSRTAVLQFFRPL